MEDEDEDEEGRWEREGGDRVIVELEGRREGEERGSESNVPSPSRIRLSLSVRMCSPSSKSSISWETLIPARSSDDGKRERKAKVSSTR